MKRILIVVVTTLIVGLSSGTHFAQSGYDLLQKALVKERAEGNLEQAIGLYKRIVQEHASDHALAAKALVEMGQCYEKLGKDEARKAYERVLRDYADQSTEANEARERLAALSGGAERVARSAGDRPVWSGGKADGFGTISPDGRFLTYVDWAGTGGLVLRDLVAGTDRRLTAGSWAEGQAEFSAISKDGKQVAYQWLLNDKGRYELRIASLHGTGVLQSRRLLDNEDFRGVAPYDWSPDGKWLAVHVSRQDLTGQIGLVAVQDGKLRVLKSVDWKGPTKIFFSPDSRYIAYDLSVSENTSERDVFVMATDGSRETVAVAHPSMNTIMGWSPDGTHLLFASDRSGSTGLWALPLAAGKPQGAATLVKADIGSSWSLGLTTSGTMYVWKGASPSYVQVAPIDLSGGKLPPSAAGSFQRFIGSRGRPDWSADGKYLAYTSCGQLGGGPCTLFIRSLETSQVRELRPRLAYFFFPRWAPDGRSFVSNGTDLKGRDGIYRIDAQTGEVSVITTSGVDAQQWAADGRHIYCRLPTGGGLPPRQALVIGELDLATGKEREVLRAPIESVTDFSVSPDGLYAAAISTSTDLQTSTLFVIPFADGDARPLLRASSPERLYGAQVTDPAWTPDSRAVIVANVGDPDAERNGLWLVPIDAGKPRKLDIDIHNWILHVGGFRLAPDGRQIAFVGAAGKTGQEIWALENFLPALQAVR